VLFWPFFLTFVWKYVKNTRKFTPRGICLPFSNKPTPLCACFVLPSVRYWFYLLRPLPDYVILNVLHAGLRQHRDQQYPTQIHPVSPLHPADKGRPEILRNIEPGDVGVLKLAGHDIWIWQKFLLICSLILSTMSLLHLALPGLNFLSYIRNKKARLQSYRLIAIWHVSFCTPFMGINRKKYATPIFPLNFLSYS